MRFFIAVNSGDDGNGSQTFHIVNTESNSRRTNRKKLHLYFREMGIPTNQLKYVMNKMGFKGDGLGTTK